MRGQPTSPAILDRIRQRQEIERKQIMAEYRPEPIEYKDGLTLVVSRCIRGAFIGMFKLSVLTTTDKNGKPLKKPIAKVLIEGVDRDSINRQLDKEIGKRYFR